MQEADRIVTSGQKSRDICHRIVCSTSLYFPENKMGRRPLLNGPEPELNELDFK
jgi:hypothetical protein